jgi:hypothetical protein
MRDCGLLNIPQVASAIQTLDAGALFFDFLNFLNFVVISLLN